MAEVKDKIVTVESLAAVHDYNEDTYLKINNALTTLGITATAAELNKMDGVTATTAELNYVDGVTSNIQTQLNGKSASNHTHTLSALGAAAASHTHTLESLGAAPVFTSSTGAVEFSYAAGSGKNVLTEFSSWDIGLHTAYAAEGLSGNPKTTQAWRFLCHKVTSTIGWIIAFGSSGDVYSNYMQDSFKGWRRIYEVAPATLWSHVGQYMAASHTATPSKALSECANGWLLLWSDYDAGSSSQNLDFCTTIIPKKNYAGEAWSGQKWLCTIPYASDSSAGDKILIKTLHIYDDKIVGDALNNASPRNDVCLRAVFEW